LLTFCLLFIPDGFLEALQVPQTEVLNTPLAGFTEKGLLLSTGEERQYGQSGSLQRK